MYKVRYKILCLLVILGFSTVSAQEGSSEVSRGELVMRAIAAAYPNRVGPAVFRDGDWAVSIRGVYFYYADGRLLPESLRGRAAEFSPQPFYAYPVNLPAWRVPSAADGERIKNQMAARRDNPPKRSPHFHDALWRAQSRDEAYSRVKTLSFLGHKTLVHYAILSELSLVEELILEAAKTNSEVRQWINSLGSAVSWNWRNIAETDSRSFHAYGAAIDLMPKRTTQEMYWIWTSERNNEWWTVPYSRRYHPPLAVIRAFEAYGFVWGGKWQFYDTIHFEYRPEIFILNGIPLRDVR
jgi:hypothetical protein